MDRETFDLAIVGAGPGGISAAARASQNGLSHVLLEAADKHANTVQQYQRRKHVMAEPSLLPLRSDVAFVAGRREGILDEWQESIRSSKLNVRFRAEVVGISGERGAFRVLLKGGDFISAKHIVLALGVQGNPRMLGIPGEDHPRVQTTLECADAHRGEAILLIGAGDSAIENALSLCDHNQVILINRGADFKKAKHSNGLRIANAIQAGKIRCHSQSRVLRIEPDPNGCLAMLSTPAGEFAQRCDRIKIGRAHV